MQQHFKILALETSTERLSLAITRGERVWVREIDAGQRHSELAIAALSDLFAEAGCNIDDMDAIAFGQGPGSFVGVRIACGLAQGLALGAGKSLIPVPTHLALAEQAVRHSSNIKKIMVAVDARMGEFYFAAYEVDSIEATGWRVVIAPMLARAGELPVLLGSDWHGVGSAFDVAALSDVLNVKYAAQLGMTSDSKAEKIIANVFPSATDVAHVAARQWAALGAEALLAPELAAPIYLRNHVAQTIDERMAAKNTKLNAPAMPPNLSAAA